MPIPTRNRSLPHALAALLALLLAAPAIAGQVRVNVSNYMFSPANVSANLGDHLVWIWTGGAHTVTSGDYSVVGDIVAGDGLFNSSPTGAMPVGATFTWKSTVTGTRPYYCQPHVPEMVGSLNLLASGAAGSSDFRITEVQFNVAGNLDLIEIANLGAAGNLGMYRVSVNGGAAQVLKNSGNVVAQTNLIVPAGGRVVLRCNTTGTNSDSVVYLPAITDLPASGSVALYVPNSINTSLALADQMLDFVQWGAGGQGNEATAQAAGFWAAGAAIQNVAAGHSIEFCGQPGQYGFGYWHEISTPNFGGDGNCATPTFSTTWGRIKTLYR